MQMTFTIVFCYKIMISYDIAWKQKSNGITATLHFPYSNRMGTWQTKWIFQKHLGRNIHTFSDTPVVKAFKTYLGSLGSAGKREPVRLQLKKPPTANTPIIMISTTVSNTATAAIKDRRISNIQASIVQCKKEPREL